jgi:hypothetical protein
VNGAAVWVSAVSTFALVSVFNAFECAYTGVVNNAV